MSLYGDMTKEVADILKCIPDDQQVSTNVWAYIGKFLSEEYNYSFDKFEYNKSVVPMMIKAFARQNHSGGSHGVAIQAIFEYLSGTMSEEKRLKINKLRDEK